MVAIDKITPYIRVKEGKDGVAIFLQGGKAYGAGGAPIKVEDLPGSLPERFRIMNPKVLEEIGWGQWQDILAKRKIKVTMSDRKTARLQDQLRKMSDKQLNRLGLSRDTVEQEIEVEEIPEQVDQQDPPVGTWTCPDCGDEVAKNYRLSHTNKHRREHLKTADG